MNGEMERQYDVDEWEKLRSRSGNTDIYGSIRLKLSDGTVMTNTSSNKVRIDFKVCFVI